MVILSHLKQQLSLRRLIQFLQQVSHSQLDPLPSNLPFELVSDTLGRGAYAFVRKAREGPGRDVFAVKFIHKGYSAQYGNITPRALAMEVSIHQHLGAHDNVIQFYRSEETDVWRWIAMEYAEGGDLFDKIEADIGVQEDIAQFYFHQMIAGMSFMHSKGIAHRDLKPENILLDIDGNLKIADFGHASVFQLRGKIKTSTQAVGSPPYVAPEVSTGIAYQADRIDIWSAGVVLFVLLTGSTPWDEPTSQSAEYWEYKSTNGRATYEPWNLIQADALSIIRGMMRIDPLTRYTIDDILQHPWYTKDNPLLSEDGTCGDSLGLATRLIEGLRVDLSSNAEPEATPVADDPMNIDSTAPANTFYDPMILGTQPDVIRNTPDALSLQWDIAGMSLSQPTQYLRDRAESMSQDYQGDILSSIVEDPSMSQFAPEPSVPLTLTQQARRFHDICPSSRLTRFYTTYTFKQFLPLLTSAMHALNVVVPVGQKPADYYGSTSNTEFIKIKLRDARKCPLTGSIGIEGIASHEGGLLCVSFEKAMGDPLEWRRFFKKVAVLCKQAIYRGIQEY